MKLTEILDIGERNVKTMYTMSQREYENNDSVKYFRLISRAGGAFCFTLGACVLPFASAEAPLSAWAGVSFFLVDGMGDLISGRHHYLPMKACLYTCRKLGECLDKLINYLGSKSNQNP